MITPARRQRCYLPGMCTLVVLNHAHPRWPVIIAANRDEFYSRPTEPPQVLVAEPRVVGGRDVQAGGSWMALNASGFVVGLTNQVPEGSIEGARRSRGEVVVEVAKAGSVAAAEAWLGRVTPGTYNPFNLLYGDATRLRLFYARDAGHTFVDVPVGVHVLPNDVLDSPIFPKVRRALSLIGAPPTDDERVFADLAAVLADTTPPDPLPAAPGPPDPAVRAALHALCVRTPVYGTRSASMVALAPGRIARFLHAEGAADQAPFLDLTALATG